MGLPLFQYTIQGSAINVSAEYGSRVGLKGKGKAKRTEEDARDETEDLYQLLLKVKVSLNLRPMSVIGYLADDKR